MNKYVYSVGELTRELRSELESGYRSIWVEGEISGLATPASGHWYFSLKENNALIRCAFFRNRRARTTLTPKNGMQVLVSGQISLYEPRGDLQFIASFMEDAGEGALRRAFDLLKAKLSEQGLFDSEHKRPIPEYPQKIGIVTSQTGAALQDILTTLSRRHPTAHVLLYPVLVQGELASSQISNTLDLINSRNEVEVLILARGGGSLEDLQAFNEECVAQAIHRSTIPIITGVGHETDFTIADMTSDMRAATPTAAAELVAPDIQHVKQRIHALRDRLKLAGRRIFRNHQQAVDYTTSRLIHPAQKLSNFEKTRKSLEQRIALLMNSRLEQTRFQLQLVQNRLDTNTPNHRISAGSARLEEKTHALQRVMSHHLSTWHNTLASVREKLTLVSPKHTLNRGYAIVQRGKDEVIMDTNTIKEGETLKVTLAQGRIDAKVENIDP